MQPSPRFCFAREPGFTLIEVLVVLAVLASLAGIGMAAAEGARSIADHQRARADLAVLAAAFESARAHLGQYPAPESPAAWYAVLRGRADAHGQPLALASRGLLDPSGLTLAVADEADPANHPVDPWGRSYHYRLLAGRDSPAGTPFLLYSAGHDGDPGRQLAGGPDDTDPATADNLYASR